MADDQYLLNVAEAIAEGERVDWADAERQSSTDRERALLRSLRVLADIAEVAKDPSSRRTSDDSVAPPSMWGHLRILDQLGRGGFGTVYRAWDSTLEREVALKLVHAAAVPQSVSLDRLRQEARRLARVRHPNVVTVHGADSRDGRFGLWMDLIAGYTLSELLAAQGLFSAREAAAIGMDVCRALAAVHRAGLLHGDIKASNVMREDGGRVVLMDFGAVRAIAADQNQTAGVQGTLLFLAPEVIEGDTPSVASDIYSLGVLLYQLVTGKYPVTGGSVAEVKLAHQRGMRTRLIDVRPDLPAAFVDVVERSLMPEPHARYHTAGHLGTALADVIGAHFEPERSPQRGGRLMVAALAVVALGVAGLARMGWVTGAGAPVVMAPNVANALESSAPDKATFQVSAAFFAVKGNATTRLANGSRVTPGDQLFLTIDASRPVYVYVVNQDDIGHSYLLFPLPGVEPGNPIPGGHTYRLPGVKDAEQHHWVVDTAGGREHFFVYASENRLTEFEQLLAALPRAEVGRPVLPLSAADIRTLRSVGSLTPAATEAAPASDANLSHLALLSDDAEATGGLWARRITFDNPLK